jgi:hypothetical protein
MGVRLALLAVLLAGAGRAAQAQAAGSGILTGKLTDLHSTPLDGATVVVRNEGTGAQAEVKTQKNGSFRFSGLEPGAYTVEAASERLGRGRLEGVLVSAGHEAHVQAAMAFEPVVPRRTAEAVVAAPPAAEAIDQLRELALVEGRGSELAREKLITETAVVSGLLDAEALRRLTLSARSLPAGTRAIPALEAQVLVGAVASEPLKLLNLSGHAEPEAANMAGASNGQMAAIGTVSVVAVSEAAAIAAHAAIASIQAGASLAGAKAAPAAAATVDPVTEAVATKLTADELQNLPAAGRRWQDFVLDTPTAATAAGGTSSTLLRGTGHESPETSIDGVSTRMAFGGQGSNGPESGGQGANGQGGSSRNSVPQAWAGGSGSPVAEAAIREVETAAGNAEAEGARTAGGQVSVETARGTNGLHGQGFLFDRQNTWGAQNPFTQWVKETAPATQTGLLPTVPVFGGGAGGSPEPYTPPDHEAVWGIGLGGQISRDKLFWFAALDSYNRNDPGLSMVKHPYLTQTPSPCESTPCAPTITGFFAQPSDCQMQMLSARLGLTSQGSSSDGCVSGLVQGATAYSQALETLDGLLGPAPRTAAQRVGFGRIDWKAAERHRFTFEGIGATWNSPGGGLTRLSETYGNHSFGSSKASEEWLLGRWEGFLTPNLLAVTQGSVGRNILSARPSTPSAFEQLFLGPNAYGQLPEIVVDNRYGFTIGNPSRFGQGSYPDERLYQAQESVDWVRGSLLVKAGFDLSHNFDGTSLLRNQTGTYTYSNVENFVSDALVFANYGIAALNFIPGSPENSWHNCDNTGTAWQDSTGQLEGGGYLPCYSYYSQTLGPTNWNLSTNDWSAFSTVQWQPRKLLVVSGGLRWEREQLPPPIAALNNPELPSTERLPSLGNDWGPRISLALGNLERHWPVLRVGYGMYFGRTENATVETALTQTGSANGDLKFFLRPTDNCQGCAGGAPPFPYVLSGPPGSVVKPGATDFSPNFRNPEVHQAVVAVEEALPGHVQVTASALVSLGRRLPVSVDANLGLPAQTITYNVCDQTPTGPDIGQCGNSGVGPIKAAQIKVPFYASEPSVGIGGWLNPDYQEIDQFTSKANSTYEAGVLKVVRYGRRGLTLHAHYTYAHAADWNPNESPLNPAALAANDFSHEYGTSDLDMRHSAAAFVVYEPPWKLRGKAGMVANGWMISGIGQVRSGLPFTMRTSGALAEEFTSSGTPIVGLGPGMNGSGGDNRVYGVGSDNQVYDIGRNTYRYPATWKADLRVGKKFDMGQLRQLELLVESFNLFNHQNVTELETTGYSIESGTPPSELGAAGTPPTLNFLTGLKVNSTNGLATTAFGQPLNVNATNFYRERQVQLGLRMRF